MLRLESLSFAYGDRVLFDRVSLTFPEKGLILLQGPSGCGKTTLFRLICGFLTPSSGKIITPPKKDISVDFQEPRLFPWMTVRKNLEAVAGDRWEALLRLVEMSESAEKYPEQLSGGMKKRVSLARALGYGGRLMLLDEPFAGLDRDSRERLFPTVRNVSESALVLMISHDELPSCDGVINLTSQTNTKLEII